jgi:hypothetical protein
MSSCGWFPMSQQEIGEWLDQHPEALPRSLDDLATFPMAFRRVMVNRVAPEMRIALWREHLGSFLRRGVELTEPQRRVIESAMVQMPELVGEGGSGEAILELEREAAAVFSRQEMQLLLATIGAPEPPGGLPLPHGDRR